MMHYYKKNIGDYAKKTGRLSMLEHGAYTLLLDSCYDRERFPTREEAIDWTWARTPEEIAAVEFVLSRFFTLEGDRYIQNRIKEELSAYHERSAKNSQIAKDREENRRNRKKDVDDLCTNRDRTVHESPPNQEPLTNNHKPLHKEKINKKEIPPAPPPAVPTKNGTRLPDDFIVPEEWIDEALAKNPNFDYAFIKNRAEVFVDYWIAIPGAKGRKLNWQATFRNWVRNSRPPAPTAKPNNGFNKFDASDYLRGNDGYGNPRKQVIDITDFMDEESQGAIRNQAALRQI